MMGELLRKAREAAGFTQREVARRLDVNQSRISRMETGNRRISAEELVQLARLYNVDVTALIPRT